MQNKLEELTEKIYREGLEKGNEEAEKIVSSAKTQADEIIAAAKAEEQRILQDARKASQELKENTESELQLTLRQALNNLRQQIADLIGNRVIHESVSGMADDPSFIRDILLAIAGNWSPASSGNADLTVLLPADKEKQLNDYFTHHAKEVMKKGIELKFDTRLKSGFEIGPSDGSFRISFTDEVFESFFKDYLRPRLMEFLYGK